MLVILRRGGSHLPSHVGHATDYQLSWMGHWGRDKFHAICYISGRGTRPRHRALCQAPGHPARWGGGGWRWQGPPQAWGAPWGAAASPWGGGGAGEGARQVSQCWSPSQGQEGGGAEGVRRGLVAAAALPVRGSTAGEGVRLRVGEDKGGGVGAGAGGAGHHRGA